MVLTTTILTAAKAAGISASLLISICTVETGMRNVNHYHDGASVSAGICQIKISTARSVAPYADLLSLQQIGFNLYIAGLYLKKLDDKYHNLTHVIAAYNAGHVTISNGLYSNQRYVNKVMNRYVAL
jgi:hypothetical protein